MRNEIAFKILDHWGYSLTVGDLDGRNYKANDHKWERKDKSYKRTIAVMHAYKLADIAIQCIARRSQYEPR